jgi:branched-chain amino acid transport system permease protein
VRRRLDSLTTLGCYLAAVAAVSALASTGNDVLQRVALLGLANLVLVVSLHVFTGLSGVFSFAQAGFAAVGAYGTALLTVPPDQKPILYPDAPAWTHTLHLDPVVAILVGAVIAAAVAGLVGLPLMRLFGLAAALGTLAFLQIVHVVGANWNAFTEGSAGVSGIPITATLWRAYAVAAVAITLAWYFQRSRIGLALRASRDDELAARSVGLAVVRQRWAAFVLGGFLAGAAGGVYAQFLGTLTPDVFYLPLTFLTLAMLVIGGIGSLAGAITGVVIISALAELLRHAELGFHLGGIAIPGRPGTREVALALLLLGILVLRPRGLTGGKELTALRTPRLRVRRHAQAPSALANSSLGGPES